MPQTMLHNGSWCICEDAKDPKKFANRNDILTLMQKTKNSASECECHSHSHLLLLTSCSPLSAPEPHLVCTAAIIHAVQPNILEKAWKHYVLPAIYIIHCNIYLQIGCWFSAYLCLVPKIESMQRAERFPIQLSKYIILTHLLQNLTSKSPLHVSFQIRWALWKVLVTSWLACPHTLDNLCDMCVLDVLYSLLQKLWW